MVRVEFASKKAASRFHRDAGKDGWTVIQKGNAVRHTNGPTGHLGKCCDRFAAYARAWLGARRTHATVHTG